MWNDEENGCELDAEILIVSSMSKLVFLAAAVASSFTKTDGRARLVFKTK